MLRPGRTRGEGGLPGLGVLGCEQDSGEHAGQRGERGEPAALDELGKVPLGDVGDLVRDHRRELALRFRDHDEARVHRDDPPRPRERVDGGGVDHEKAVPPPRIRARDALSQGVDVVDHLGVVDQSKALADLAEERIPETFFLGARERFARRIAEVGQRGVGGGRGHDGEQPPDGRDRYPTPSPRTGCGAGEDAPCAGRRDRGHGQQSSPEIRRIQDSSSAAVDDSAG